MTMVCEMSIIWLEYYYRNYLPMNKYHRMFVARWYLVLYQIRDDTVYVDYTLDCRKDYSWLIL